MKEIKPHSFLMPKDGQFGFDEFTDDELRALSADLTEKEKADPDSVYRDLVPAAISEEHQKAIDNGPIDVRYAFEPEDYGKYMNTTGNMEVENGYCVLPSGLTYAAVLIRQEGRTDEVIDYYNKNFAKTDSLFYKTWYPGAHYLHFNDGGAVEDFGYGRLKMKFTAQLSAAELGIDIDKISENDPACIYIGGTAALSRNLDSDDPSKEEANIILFYHRETEYGREVRIRLFCGIGYRDGKFFRTIPDKDKAENMARCTMNHLIHEYTNDDVLERAYYRDYREGRN